VPPLKRHARSEPGPAVVRTTGAFHAGEAAAHLGLRAHVGGEPVGRRVSGSGTNVGRRRFGASQFTTREAVVSRLVAIEELAGVDVLCTDKTGTLTQNNLTLGDPFSASASRIAVDEVILCVALASRAEDNDTIDTAVIGGLAGRRVAPRRHDRGAERRFPPAPRRPPDRPHPGRTRRGT
jgi:hypothetical protein